MPLWEEAINDTSQEEWLDATILPARQTLQLVQQQDEGYRVTNHFLIGFKTCYRKESASHSVTGQMPMA